jgi:hypothetical protein
MNRSYQLDMLQPHRCQNSRLAFTTVYITLQKEMSSVSFVSEHRRGRSVTLPRSAALGTQLDSYGDLCVHSCQHWHWTLQDPPPCFKKQLNNGSRWKLFNPALTLAYKMTGFRYSRDLWRWMFRISFSISKWCCSHLTIWLGTNIQRKTGQLLRSSIFWDVMKHWLVFTDVSGQSINPVFKSQSSWTFWSLKTQQLVRKHRYTPDCLTLYDKSGTLYRNTGK